MPYTIREANAKDADRINELFIQMLQTIYEREEMIRERGFDEGFSKGQAQGQAQGQTLGETLCLFRQITKKLAKGKAPEIIAEELEEKEELVVKICRLIRENPDKSLEETAHML